MDAVSSQYLRQMQNFVMEGRLKGENIINSLQDVISMNGIRQNVMTTFQEAGLSVRGIGSARNRNISFADISINRGTSFTVQAFSGKERVSANFVGYKTQKRKLKTKIILGSDRSQDPEAKILESLLSRTKENDFIDIVLRSERPICESCLEVMTQFLDKRQNATITVIGSVIRG